MRFYAPYSGLRAIVDGRELYFPHGVMEVGPKDKKTVELIKKIPLSMGEITNQNGNCVNAPKPKKTKPKSKVKSQTKPATKQETGDNKNVHQSEIQEREI